MLAVSEVQAVNCRCRTCSDAKSQRGIGRGTFDNVDLHPRLAAFAFLASKLCTFEVLYSLAPFPAGFACFSALAALPVAMLRSSCRCAGQACSTKPSNQGGRVIGNAARRFEWERSGCFLGGAGVFSCWQLLLSARPLDASSTQLFFGVRSRKPWTLKFSWGVLLRGGAGCNACDLCPSSCTSPTRPVRNWGQPPDS